MANFKSKILRGAALSFLALSLVQCSSQKDKAADFEANLTNGSPLVRTTDRTLGTGTVTSNWIDLNIQVKNGTEFNVRIEEVMLYVTVDGNESGPFTFDLGLMSRSNEDTGESWEYFDFCTYPKKSSRVFTLSACANGYVGEPPNPDPSLFPVVQQLTLYMGGLPKPADSTNLTFPARVELHGVFLKDDGTDEDRFLKTIHFSTR